MRLFQSKKSRRLLLFIGLPVLVLAGYIGYELYTFNQSMEQLGEAVQGIADIFSAFHQVSPDSAAVIDSTQILEDSLLVK